MSTLLDDSLVIVLAGGAGERLFPLTKSCVRRPVGCASCNQTGYSGRDGIFEILPIDNAIRDITKKCFEDLRMSKAQVVSELWEFMRNNKEYWLAPIVITLVAVGALLVLAKGSAIAPFIYTLF